jgi:pimeloyl-ACP methyl ester carboxylesterase
MPFAPIGGIQLYYEIHGPVPGDGPALVFAHGAGGNHLSWWQQVPHFASRWTCVTFDHRGFGQSRDLPDGPGGAAFADDLHGLLDHLDIRRAAIVAQSMGGWTAVGFALRWPERVERLVLCDTHGGLTDDEVNRLWGEALAALAALPPTVHPAAGVRMADEQPALHFLYTQIAALNAHQVTDAARFIREAGSTPLARAAEITVPVLVIAGSEDVLITPPLLAHVVRAFPRGRIEHVPRAGHSVYFERADLLNELIDRFLAS